jgi:uncharacterized membrane protein
MGERLKTIREVVRVGGKLRELLVIKDEKGTVLHKVLSPLMVEFRLRDVVQVMVGASILSIPIAYTEETWRLAATLPLENVLGFLALSLFFIATFVYYNYYRDRLGKHWVEFLKRSLSTYIISFAVVAVVLTLIQQTPWATDWLLAVKRVILVAFPASMSAVVADVIK